jgi:uncharacterized membrane protein
MLGDILLVILATLAPISELRGGIPLGLLLGIDPLSTFLLTVVFNSLVFFPVYFLMKFFYDNLFSKITLFNRYLNKLRHRGKPYVDKYGLLGIMFFVAIPLPLTGAYAGTFLSWLLDIEWKRAFAAVALGVIIAGAIVLSASLGIINFIF